MKPSHTFSFSSEGLLSKYDTHAFGIPGTQIITGQPLFYTTHPTFIMTTDPKQYSIELGQERCRNILRDLLYQHEDSTPPKIVRDAVLGCVLYLGKLTNDGHWQIQRSPRYLTRPSGRTGDNHHRAYYVHRIAYVALHDSDPILTASHLCGHGNCINPFHLVDESIGSNVARINCLGYVDCLQHNHRIATLCQHTPRCIKNPIPADSCCLATLGDESTAISSSQSEPTTEPLAAFEGFMRHEPQPSDWPGSSPQSFDPRLEIASSPRATPPPPIPPIIQVPRARSPLSPPAWHSTDTRESQDSSEVSEWDELPDSEP